MMTRRNPPRAAKVQCSARTVQGTATASCPSSIILASAERTLAPVISSAERSEHQAALQQAPANRVRSRRTSRRRQARGKPRSDRAVLSGVRGLLDELVLKIALQGMGLMPIPIKDHDGSALLHFLSCCKQFRAIKVPVSLDRHLTHTRDWSEKSMRFEVVNATLVIRQAFIALPHHCLSGRRRDQPF